MQKHKEESGAGSMNIQTFLSSPLTQAALNWIFLRMLRQKVRGLVPETCLTRET